MTKRNSTRLVFEKQFYEKPEVNYCESSGKIRGGLQVVFQNKYGHASQVADLNDKIIKLFISYTGKERKCLECGGNRELVLELDLDGNYLGQHEVCDK